MRAREWAGWLRVVRPVQYRNGAGPDGWPSLSRLIRCLFVLALIGLPAATGALAQDEEPDYWAVDCDSTHPLAAGRCRIAPLPTAAEPEFAVMFAYVGRELTFTIVGQRRFTQGEVRIDGKQIFVTRICGRGYCFMDGQLATQLADQFRKGRQVEIEVSTPVHDINFTVEYQLKGFESVFSSFATRGS